MLINWLLIKKCIDIWACKDFGIGKILGVLSPIIIFSKTTHAVFFSCQISSGKLAEFKGLQKQSSGCFVKKVFFDHLTPGVFNPLMPCAH